MSLDSNLQAFATAVGTEIKKIHAASDVVDVVGTKSALNSYDKTKLTDNDVVKVLADESLSDAQAYYRYSKTGNSFTLVGTITKSVPVASSENLGGVKLALPPTQAYEYMVAFANPGGYYQFIYIPTTQKHDTWYYTTNGRDDIVDPMKIPAWTNKPTVLSISYSPDPFVDVDPIQLEEVIDDKGQHLWTFNHADFGTGYGDYSDPNILTLGLEGAVQLNNEDRAFVDLTNVNSAIATNRANIATNTSEIATIKATPASRQKLGMIKLQNSGTTLYAYKRRGSNELAYTSTLADTTIALSGGDFPAWTVKPTFFKATPSYIESVFDNPDDDQRVALTEVDGIWWINDRCTVETPYLRSVDDDSIIPPAGSVQLDQNNCAYVDLSSLISRIEALENAGSGLASTMNTAIES